MIHLNHGLLFFVQQPFSFLIFLSDLFSRLSDLQPKERKVTNWMTWFPSLRKTPSSTWILRVNFGTFPKNTTTTNQPTNQPTNEPTNQPTKKPTSQPTNQTTIEKTHRKNHRKRHQKWLEAEDDGKYRSAFEVCSASKNSLALDCTWRLAVVRWGLVTSWWLNQQIWKEMRKSNWIIKPQAVKNV